MNDREELYQFVAKAHERQVDKAGYDYYTDHLYPVSKMVPERLRFAALGHDLLEDTDLNPGNLYRAGFTNHEVMLIHDLTRHKDVPTTLYYHRIKREPDALIIKMADIFNNLSRLDNIADDATRQRLTAKYHHALEALTRD
jgi:(p)ppGpp synthase/HD superfamily hydrolase